MYFDIHSDNEAARLEMERIDRRAQEAWRFRNLKTKPARVISTALSALLGVLIR